MIRRFTIAALAVALTSPVAAQAPAGWQMRLDRSTSISDPDKTPEVKFTQMGPGFHVTTGPAAVLWSANNTVSGTFTLRGTFHLMKPSGHPNYYGLVFGGGNLQGAGQSYLYFLIAQNGAFIVKHRASDATTHDVKARTAHTAIVKPDAKGASANALEVRVGADKIDYVVNGIVVHTTPRAGMTARTDGLWGVRINHELDVHVEKLGASQPSTR